MSRSSLMGPGPWQRESQGKSERLRGLCCNEFRESPQWASPPWMGFASVCQHGGCIHREPNRVNMGRHSSNYKALPSEKKGWREKTENSREHETPRWKGRVRERMCARADFSPAESCPIYLSVALPHIWLHPAPRDNKILLSKVI